MLEFLISRTMLAVMGVVVVGLAVGGIAALDEGRTISMEQQVADNLAEEITKIASHDGYTAFVFRVDDYLPAEDWSVELTNDTVTVIHANDRCSAAIGCPVVMDGGRKLATTTDSIVVEQGQKTVRLYVVNVDDTPLTASTNVLQSCRLL